MESIWSPDVEEFGEQIVADVALLARPAAPQHDDSGQYREDSPRTSLTVIREGVSLHNETSHETIK